MREDEKSPKGLITISTARIGSNIQISLQDTGTGIPARVQEKIFDPFFTTKAPGKGTGQGLSLVFQTIHERHNGEIQFTSREGEGTLFRITLPISSSENVFQEPHYRASLFSSEDTHSPRHVPIQSGFRGKSSRSKGFIN
jgi:signal transduction histidine kinase